MKDTRTHARTLSHFNDDVLRRNEANDTFSKQSFDTFNGTISKVIENWCDANFLHLNENSTEKKCLQSKYWNEK